MPDETINVKFVISKEAQANFDWGDLEVVQMIKSGSADEIEPRDLRLFLARFVVDANDKPMDHVKATRLLRKINQAKVGEVMTKFMEAIQESAVPNGKGNGSSSPSNPGQAEPFPDGSAP
jgi:hypothetical protein